MAATPDGTDIQQRVKRSRELKGELIDFAKTKRFERWLEPIVTKTAKVTDARQRETEWIRGLDDFIMTFRFPDGDGVIDRFLAARKDLAADDRELLESWRDNLVDGIFELRAKKILKLTLFNLLDDQEYEAHTAVGAESLWRFSEGEFVIVRLAPLTEGTWVISGPIGGAPTSATRRITRLALDLVSRAPAMAFTSEDILARSWVAMRRDRERFIEFFGADEVILKTDDAAERVNDFRAQAKQAAVDEGGDVPATYMAPFQLPESIRWARTLGVIYDETDGIGFLADYAKLKELFADPELAADKEHARLFHAYLKDDSISPAPLRRLAAAHPDTVDAVFRKLLKKPTFTWADDGEALLHKHKPQYFRKTPQPKLAVVGARLRELAGI